MGAEHTQDALRENPMIKERDSHFRTGNRSFRLRVISPTFSSHTCRVDSHASDMDLIHSQGNSQPREIYKTMKRIDLFLRTRLPRVMSPCLLEIPGYIHFIGEVNILNSKKRD